MRAEPLVSVITPTRNRPALLREAYDSLKAQTVQDFEFILVVNGRNASSLGEARRIRDEGETTKSHPSRPGRVTVLYDPRFNYYEALNAGLSAARGSLVHFLSDDDLLEPTFLETCCKALAGDPALEMVGVDHRVLLDPPRVLREMPCMLTHPGAESAREGLPALGAYVINCTVFRKSLLEKMRVKDGPFDTSFRILGDEDFFIRLSKTNTRARHICAPLIQYRVHTQQVTQKQELRHFFEHTRILREIHRTDSPNAIAARLAWSANRVARYLGTKVKRKMGIRVDHEISEVDQLRWPELRKR